MLEHTIIRRSICEDREATGVSCCRTSLASGLSLVCYLDVKAISSVQGQGETQSLRTVKQGQLLEISLRHCSQLGLPVRPINKGDNVLEFESVS